MRRIKHRHLSQEEVLSAAVDIAFELGLPSVTRSQVAVRLGAAERSVRASWPDADELVAAAFSRIVSTELAEAKREVLAHHSPTKQMSVLLATVAEQGRPDLDAVWTESWSMGRRNAALGDAMREEQGAWHSFIAAIVRRGMRAGDYVDVDPEEVAAHLLAVIDGVNAYSLIGYHTEFNHLKLLHAVARTHLGTAFDGAPLSTV